MNPPAYVRARELVRSWYPVVLLAVSLYALAWGLGWATADMSRAISTFPAGLASAHPGLLPQLDPEPSDWMGQGDYVVAIVLGAIGSVSALRQAWRRR